MIDSRKMIFITPPGHSFRALSGNNQWHKIIATQSDSMTLDRRSE